MDYDIFFNEEIKKRFESLNFNVPEYVFDFSFFLIENDNIACPSVYMFVTLYF